MVAKKAETVFLLDNKKYHAFPLISQFLQEAGITAASSMQKIELILENNGIFDVSQLFSFSIRDLEQLGMKKKTAITLTRHLQLLRRRTNLILNTNQLQEYASNYTYLSTGNGLFDALLSYANGQTGLRSKTLVEVYGSAGIGKTQLMKSLAIMCMRPTPGWNRIVYYIDTEGAFDLYRLYEIGKLHGVEKRIIDKNLRVAKAYNFDEVEQILTEIAINARHEDIGLIVIDSIIAPLKAQYPLDEDLSKLQERQQHLKIVLDQLKSMAQIHNLIALITNQVRADIGGKGEIVPQGGNVLAHSSDIRLSMNECHKPQMPESYEVEKLNKVELKLVNIKLIDSGFIAPGNADMIIGRMGMADPRYWNMFAELLHNITTETVDTLMEKLYS